MAATKSGKKTGRPRSLHEPDIINAALEIGLSDASMPTVARRLGVTHSALYRYYADRNALLVASIGTAIERTQWPDGSECWRDTLTGLADSMWHMFSEYPGLAEAMLTVQGTPPEGTALVARIVEGLHRQGFSVHDAMLAVDFVSDLTLTGFSTMARLDQPTDDGATTRERFRADWSRPEILSEVVADDSGWYGRGWLDEKIAVMLDGLERRITS
ncbi:TetR/AcrR family transcriptional regulator [Hoyosella subflava]|uniref:Putative TetR family transcriptional regulator n=1 Tax=Hoyosella subflava (strain DSM 45089 / JCM 17490 / NBRC 109087 / DQS3-9A1) TaxID=443218 RepID=F6ENX3_HOYSD|nr:TetR/AcrR family transcriptional regulator [Hoyosella subflava]AEF40439.1 Putative TetR family transcriptional regulator [Hoyosella subflava DQS3-9A1]